MKKTHSLQKTNWCTTQGVRQEETTTYTHSLEVSKHKTNQCVLGFVDEIKKNVFFLHMLFFTWF